MSSIHKRICLQVQIDFSTSNRGRLQELKQGFGIPYSDYKKGIMKPVHFGADNGTSDLFGDEWFDICAEISNSKCPLKNEYNGRGDCSFCSIGNAIKPCYIEVKTIAYPKLSEDQVNFMNAQSARGARCYVAMENEDKSEKIYSLTEWEIK